MYIIYFIGMHDKWNNPGKILDSQGSVNGLTHL